MWCCANIGCGCGNDSVRLVVAVVGGDFDGSGDDSGGGKESYGAAATLRGCWWR